MKTLYMEQWIYEFHILELRDEEINAKKIHALLRLKTQLLKLEKENLRFESGIWTMAKTNLK